MAFLLTLLYILGAFLSPPVLFGPIADFHAEIILAVLALLASIPSLATSNLFRRTQTRAILALCFFVVASICINVSFRDGAVEFYNFLPVTFTYFLCALNCKTKRHLQLMFAALFAGSCYFILHGFLDLHAGVSPSLYLYGDEGLRRLRGLGLVNDPNDFSQVMVSLVPCMFLLRRGNTKLVTALTVGVPVAVLVTGLYLAHSRGAAIGLMVVIILASRRKIGTLPALAMAGCLFAGSLAFGWSGGREVSVEAGSDRLDAWLVGLEFIKAHPLLGIGNNRFGELNDITAHNSVMVCAAENGLLGFISWILFIFATFRTGLRVVNARRAAASVRTKDEPANARNAWAAMLTAKAKPAPGGIDPDLPQVPEAPSEVEDGKRAPLVASQRTAQLLVFALSGFLTAGWFLSRALSPWMFMYGGMMVAVERMATEEGYAIEEEPLPYLLRWAAVIAIVLLALVYLSLKVRALTGG